jgi:hypothetical protein
VSALPVSGLVQGSKLRTGSRRCPVAGSSTATLKPRAPSRPPFSEKNVSVLRANSARPSPSVGEPRPEELAAKRFTHPPWQA